MKRLVKYSVISSIVLYCLFSWYNGSFVFNRWTINSYDWFMSLFFGDLISNIIVYWFGWWDEIDNKEN